MAVVCLCVYMWWWWEGRVPKAPSLPASCITAPLANCPRTGSPLDPAGTPKVSTPCQPPLPRQPRTPGSHRWIQLHHCRPLPRGPPAKMENTGTMRPSAPPCRVREAGSERQGQRGRRLGVEWHGEAALWRTQVPCAPAHHPAGALWVGGGREGGHRGGAGAG